MRVWARSRIILALAVAIAVAGLLVAVARGPSRPVSLEDRVEDIASGLRCPVCQNLSVADSPSKLAQQMREAIAARLRSGQSAAQIRGYFADRYGEWILLSPSRQGVGMVAWVGPVAVIVAGAATIVLVLRRRDPFPETSLSEGERARIKGELATLEEPD